MVVILRNEDGTMEKSISSSMQLLNVSYLRTVIDFNQDNLLDIVVVVGNGYNASVNVLLGNGDGTFDNIISFNCYCLTIYHMSIGNLNNDRFLDFAITGILLNSSTVLTVIFGNANGTVTEGTSLNLLIGFFQLYTSEIAELNGDNYSDIIVTPTFQFDVNVNVYLGYGNGSFAAPKLSFVGWMNSSLATVVGDFNDDTIEDLIVVSVYKFMLLLGYNDGTFDAPVQLISNTDLFIELAINDFNNDGHLDFIKTRYTSNTLNIYYGNGNGTFELDTIFSLNLTSSHNYATIVDFNNDGYQDLFATFDLGVYIFLNTGQCDNGFENFQTTTSI